jgi:uncharacterized protein
MARRQRRGRRLFFATDIHGSESCFRKFLNAGEFYDCDDLVLGGDIAGKLLVPITRTGTGYRARYGEARYDDLDESGLADFKAAIRRTGNYFLVGAEEELQRLASPAELDLTFRRVVYESMQEWAALADERLRGTGRRCFVAPGNDDFLEIDDALRDSESMELVEGEVVQLDDDREMLTTGYSNPTPWDTERELPEDELERRIEAMMARVRDPARAVAVIHPPPYDSGIDAAPKLDDELGMSLELGGVALAPVGSTAVRRVIERHQPLLGLHGHVHEGRGAVRVGRTLCINPGSEYTEGVLCGAVVELAGDEVIGHQLVTG